MMTSSMMAGVMNHPNMEEQLNNQQIEKGTLIHSVQTSNIHCLCYVISNSSSHKSRTRLSTFTNTLKLNKREKGVMNLLKHLSIR